MPQIDEEDPLLPTDEYEQYIDDIQNGLALCSGIDCRSPLDGPWVIMVEQYDENRLDVRRMMCLRCFCSEELGIDPSEAGL